MVQRQRDLAGWRAGAEGAHRPAAWGHVQARKGKAGSQGGNEDREAGTRWSTPGAGTA